jgi:hypothetical protein
MAPRFLTILTGRNLPKIQQPREAEPSIINEKTIADFARVVEWVFWSANQNRPGRSIRPHARALCEAIGRLVEIGLKAKK